MARKNGHFGATVARSTQEFGRPLRIELGTPSAGPPGAVWVAARELFHKFN
jgi:hypothetical protein